MDQSYSLSRAALSDAPALAELGARTFSETFGHLYEEEDLKSYLRTCQSREFYDRMLSSLDMALWIVRTPDGEPAAYAMAGKNMLPIEDAGARAGEIKRIYVDTAHQGRGIGLQLADIVIEWATGRRFAPLYVGVWADNTKAQRLYLRYGFEKVGEYDFKVGNHRDREFILKRTAPLDGR